MRTITLSLLCISTILSISQTVSAFDHETSPTKRFPTLPFPYSNDRRYLQDLDLMETNAGDDMGFERTRRIPYFFPALHSKSFWKRVLPSLQDSIYKDEKRKKKRKRDEVEFEYLNQQRHRLPGDIVENQDVADVMNLLENNDKKRGIMYYYPNYRYAFFKDDKNGNHDKDDEDQKKRNRRESGGLFDRIRNDDPSDMGYD